MDRLWQFATPFCTADSLSALLGVSCESRIASLQGLAAAVCRDGTDVSPRQAALALVEAEAVPSACGAELPFAALPATATAALLLAAAHPRAGRTARPTSISAQAFSSEALGSAMAAAAEPSVRRMCAQLLSVPDSQRLLSAPLSLLPLKDWRLFGAAFSGAQACSGRCLAAFNRTHFMLTSDNPSAPPAFCALLAKITSVSVASRTANTISVQFAGSVGRGRRGRDVAYGVLTAVGAVNEWVRAAAEALDANSAPFGMLPAAPPLPRRRGGGRGYVQTGRSRRLPTRTAALQRAFCRLEAAQRNCHVLSAAARLAAGSGCDDALLFDADRDADVSSD
eukprot:TRINITY_DN21512_c0_g1_i1.p1 TRINITY_DN21512_c0_g1~~TRINITY_DN21512_c0_g1_i1.p1  ORF type:complete len:352 (+),score=94.80 TRINITY_DN21512_c0_g1_i1:44-1057(+)